MKKNLKFPNTRTMLHLRIFSNQTISIISTYIVFCYLFQTSQKFSLNSYNNNKNLLDISSFTNSQLLKQCTYILYRKINDVQQLFGTFFFKLITERNCIWQEWSKKASQRYTTEKVRTLAVVYIVLHQTLKSCTQSRGST